MARAVYRTQIRDIANLLIAGQYIIIEANGRISSTGGIAPNSNVEGNIRFTGAITANTFNSAGFGVPTIESSTNINLSANGSNGGAVVVTNSPLRLRSYTTTDRANITASAGDVIYNSTLSLPQVYGNSAWKTIVAAGPAFSAYANVATSIPSGVQTKVAFGVEHFDTDNCFDNSRFTPTIPGYYQFNSSVRVESTSGTGEIMIVLYKNGSEYKRGWNNSGVQIGTAFWSVSVSALANANGTTDYFEIYVQQTDGTSKNTTAAGAQITWFDGCMVRGL